MEFRSTYKNLTIVGTNIRFRNGRYNTEKKEEIELLKKTKNVTFEVEKDFKITDRKAELEELTVKQLTEKITKLGINPKSSSTKSDLIDILIELEKG